MPAFIDMTGHRYGKLTVLKQVDKMGTHIRWKCRCDCGKETICKANTLRMGSALSCGCYHIQRATEANTTHGMRDTLEYSTWCGMLGRCYNPNGERYKNYGGRGIKVCDRWIHSFPNFHMDLGDKPSSAHSLERKDVNGNYEPSNCCWATEYEQSRNRRNNKIHEYQGKHYVQVDLAREFNLSHYQIRYHLNQGKTIDQAIRYLLSKISKVTEDETLPVDTEIIT